MKTIKIGMEQRAFPCVRLATAMDGPAVLYTAVAFHLALPVSHVFVCLISHLLRHAKTHGPGHILMHMLAHARLCSTCVPALCILDDT